MTDGRLVVLAGVLMLLGVAVMLYVGVWLGLIGGIITIARSLMNEGGVLGMGIAWGIIRILVLKPLGWVLGALIFGLGCATINEE